MRGVAVFHVGREARISYQLPSQSMSLGSVARTYSNQAFIEKGCL